ncbi:MAG: nuclear transport factor 2 family protein [Pseudomonadota bacterium]
MGLFTKDRTQELLSLDTALNDRIIRGEALEAFEEYYAEDVVMQENDAEPTVGKASNRKREQDFFSAVTEFRGASVLAQGGGGDTTFSQSEMDFTHRDWGDRKYRQVAVRTWKDDKIVREVFYYG